MARRKVRTGMVAILDGLGTRSDLSEAALKFLDRRDRILRELPAALRSAEIFGSMGGEQKIKAPGPPKVVTFGDNIVLSWEVAEVGLDELLGFSQPIMSLIVQGIEAGLLLRGAVSFGEFILDGNTIVGPALSDAVHWSERADWIGAVATPKLGLRIASCSDEWKRDTPNSYSFFSCFYTRYPVPIKGGPPLDMWCYPWPVAIQNGMSTRKLPTEAAREQLLKWLSNCSQPDVAISKFENAVKFFEWYTSAERRKQLPK